MPLPAIAAAAARAGAAAGRAGARAGRAAKRTVKRAPRPQAPGQQLGGPFSISGLFSLEGFMMLTAAVLIDLFGLVDAIPIIGNLLSYLVDIVGVLLIWGWILFFRGGGSGITGKAKGKGISKLLIRGGCTIGEFIPVLGALPFWTGLVLFELLTE